MAGNARTGHAHNVTLGTAGRSDTSLCAALTTTTALFNTSTKPAKTAQTTSKTTHLPAAQTLDPLQKLGPAVLQRGGQASVVWCVSGSRLLCTAF